MALAYCSAVAAVPSLLLSRTRHLTNYSIQQQALTIAANRYQRIMDYIVTASAVLNAHQPDGKPVLRMSCTSLLLRLPARFESPLLLGQPIAAATAACRAGCWAASAETAAGAQSITLIPWGKWPAAEEQRETVACNHKITKLEYKRNAS